MSLAGRKQKKSIAKPHQQDETELHQVKGSINWQDELIDKGASIGETVSTVASTREEEYWLEERYRLKKDNALSRDEYEYRVESLHSTSREATSPSQYTIYYIDNNSQFSVKNQVE